MHVLTLTLMLYVFLCYSWTCDVIRGSALCRWQTGECKHTQSGSSSKAVPLLWSVLSNMCQASCVGRFDSLRVFSWPLKWCRKRVSVPPQNTESIDQSPVSKHPDHSVLTRRGWSDHSQHLLWHVQESLECYLFGYSWSHRAIPDHHKPTALQRFSPVTVRIHNTQPASVSAITFLFFQSLFLFSCP